MCVNPYHYECIENPSKYSLFFQFYSFLEHPKVVVRRNPKTECPENFSVIKASAEGGIETNDTVKFNLLKHKLFCLKN